MSDESSNSRKIVCNNSVCGPIIILKYITGALYNKFFSKTWWYIVSFNIIILKRKKEKKRGRSLFSNNGGVRNLYLGAMYNFFFFFLVWNVK